MTPPTAAATGAPRPDLPVSGFRRPRWAWKLLWGAVAGTALYVIWWATYTGMHLTTRYQVLAPGEPAAGPGGTVRLVSLQRVGRLADADGSSNPEPPPPGTVWFVATLEVTKTDSSRTGLCGMELVDTERRAWRDITPSVDRRLPGCLDSELVVGTPAVVESVFAVPVISADAVAGVAVTDRTSARRTPLLTPAR